MGARGQSKTPGSGRKKGTPNQDARTLQEKARALKVDPFEILLLFAKGDWKRLGYDSKSTTKFTAAGIEFEEDVIQPAMRMKAASDACQYLYSKRKPIEDSGDADPSQDTTYDTEWG